MLRIILLLFFSSLLCAIAPTSFAQKSNGLISHDSIMALNKKAFALIFNDIGQADSLSNMAYRLALFHQDSVALARATSVIGSVNLGHAKYNLALKWYFNSLIKYENLQDTLGIITCYNNIAEVYKKLKYHESSLMYLHRARNLIIFLTKETNSSILNNLNIAHVFININKNDSAIYYLDIAQKKAKRNASIKVVSLMNYLYAKLKKNNGQLEQAIVYIEQSIHFASLTNNQLQLAEGYVLFGEIKMAEGKVKEAKDKLGKALIMGKKHGYDNIEINALQRLYQIALLEEDMPQSFTYLLKYSELKDVIYDVSVSRQAAEFETVYELEKLGKENLLLQKKQDYSSNIIKYQIAFIGGVIFALIVALFLLLAINKQRKFLKVANAELLVKRKQVEYQKKKLEKQSKTTDALNKELTLLNKNLDTRAQEIAREIEVKNKKMNKYAFMNAHKLRAPIASILGLINLFGKDISAKDEELMIIMLKESAHKLDHVVHEIRDVIDG